MRYRFALRTENRELGTAFLLHARFRFNRAVPPQQLRKILRERGAWQYHIAAYFVGLLFQVSLHM